MGTYIINAIKGGFSVVTGLATPVVQAFEDAFIVKSSSGVIEGITPLAEFGLIFCGIGLVTSLALYVIKKVVR